MRKAIQYAPLRPNAVDVLGGKNSGDNTGKCVPIIHWELEAGDEIEIAIFPKGGSENCSPLAMLTLDGEGKILVYLYLSHPLREPRYCLCCRYIHPEAYATGHDGEGTAGNTRKARTWFIWFGYLLLSVVTILVPAFSFFRHCLWEGVGHGEDNGIVGRPLDHLVLHYAANVHAYKDVLPSRPFRGPPHSCERCTSLSLL